MALRCSGWSCEQPSSPEAPGTARTAGQHERFFPPTLSLPVGTGKELPLASDFKFVVDF